MHDRKGFSRAWESFEHASERLRVTSTFGDVIGNCMHDKTRCSEYWKLSSKINRLSLDSMRAGGTETCAADGYRS